MNLKITIDPRNKMLFSSYYTLIPQLKNIDFL